MASNEVETKRIVFISCSKLARFYKRVPEEEMNNAIFFFGSKRLWLFPADAEEMAESQSQPTNYLRMDEDFKQLVLQKEEDNLVFWLKPKDYVFSGNISDGHPESYQRFSDWIQDIVDPVTNENYRPLLLDPEWWNSKENFRKGQYCNSVSSIVTNFQTGAHDYRATMELLYQSNENMEPKLFM